MAIDIPDMPFTVVVENDIGLISDEKFTFTDKVDNMAPFLAGIGVFWYSLRSDHSTFWLFCHSCAKAADVTR